MANTMEQLARRPAATPQGVGRLAQRGAALRRGATRRAAFRGPLGAPHGGLAANARPAAAPRPARQAAAAAAAPQQQLERQQAPGSAPAASVHSSSWYKSHFDMNLFHYLPWCARSAPRASQSWAFAPTQALCGLARPSCRPQPTRASLDALPPPPPPRRACTPRRRWLQPAPILVSGLIFFAAALLIDNEEPTLKAAVIAAGPVALYYVLALVVLPSQFQRFAGKPRSHKDGRAGLVGRRALLHASMPGSDAPSWVRPADCARSSLAEHLTARRLTACRPLPCPAPPTRHNPAQSTGCASTRRRRRARRSARGRRATRTQLAPHDARRAPACGLAPCAPASRPRGRPFAPAATGAPAAALARPAYAAGQPPPGGWALSRASGGAPGRERSRSLPSGQFHMRAPAATVDPTILYTPSSTHPYSLVLLANRPCSHMTRPLARLSAVPAAALARSVNRPLPPAPALQRGSHVVACCLCSAEACCSERIHAL
jgi:hypothetical protein